MARKKISIQLLYNQSVRFEKWRMVARTLQRWFDAMMFGEVWSGIVWSAWWAEPAVRFVRQGSEHCASIEYYPVVGRNFRCSSWLSYPFHHRYCAPNGWGACQEGQRQEPPRKVRRSCGRVSFNIFQPKLSTWLPRQPNILQVLFQLPRPDFVGINWPCACSARKPRSSLCNSKRLV